MSGLGKEDSNTSPLGSHFSNRNFMEITDSYPDIVLGAANLSHSPSIIAPQLVSWSYSPAKLCNCGISLSFFGGV